MVVWLLGDYESDDFFKKQQNKKCSTTLIFSENFTPGKDFKEIVHGSLSTELRTFYVPDFKDFLIKKSIKSSEKESALVEGTLEAKR